MTTRVIGWFERVYPMVWCVIVVADVIGGLTTDRPGLWLGLLFTLAFFFVTAWRFFVPSLAISPSPAAPIILVFVIAVAVRGFWLDGSFSDYVVDTRAWIGTVLLAAAVVAAVAAPRTGIREPMIGELAFPLREGRWRVVEGNGRIFNHHWPAVRQRAALDLVRVTALGRSRRGLPGGGDEKYAAFGTPISAPCAGVVIRTYDGMADGALDPSRPAGNNVIIDNGHEHILLAHMQRGTVAVDVGDRVEVGDVIGRVGNSGNSSEPHLHIHAERDGQPLRLRFVDIDREPIKGRIVRVGRSAVVASRAH